jgi:F-type H+-transporting ATPase subunit delta
VKEEIVSKAYAKALIELGVLEKIDIAKELIDLNEVINSSNELETLLFLEVFTSEEKLGVLNTILDKMNSSSLLKNFLNFMVEENRIGLFPLIFKDVVVIDDHQKGFLRGTIEGCTDIADDEFTMEIKKYLEAKVGKKIELNYEKNDNITAGYRVTVEDLQLDATLDNQLNKLKESILN